MGSSTNTACAACKFQRRKCATDCPLAPYFPPDQPKRFANVHKLFGVANVLKLLRDNPKDQMQRLVQSITYEADARDNDPVGGAYARLQKVLQEEEIIRRARDTMKATYIRLQLLEAQLSKRNSQNLYIPHRSEPVQVSELVGSPGPYMNYGQVPNQVPSPLWDMPLKPPATFAQQHHLAQQQIPVATHYGVLQDSDYERNYGPSYGGTYGGGVMQPQPQQTHVYHHPHQPQPVYGFQSHMQASGHHYQRPDAGHHYQRPDAVDHYQRPDAVDHYQRLDSVENKPQGGVRDFLSLNNQNDIQPDMHQPVLHIGTHNEIQGYQY